ncbi:MAG: serine/threonine-protein kinase [Phycisphaerae bacterium]|jgi:serine/threonine protein kinase|nr:serine/threonine-protein kinase [Phycisphaerae bacterium]
MSDPNTQRDPLEVLAEEFTERQRAGQSPSVSEYAREYPELADRIREIFPAIAAVEQLKARNERASGGRASLGPIRLERLGDFRIIRELGRGGMGIVYEAEQESLARRVAIKVLPRQALLEANQLERFQREARVAAGLHHTNIVQVLGVGEHDGFHYYVMQLVEGVALDDVVSHLAPGPDTPPADKAVELDASPAGGQSPAAQIESICTLLLGPDEQRNRQSLDYWRAIANIGLQIAGALGHAHGRNALHRDVKPANVMVNNSGLAQLTDFGLAKAAGSPEVTQSGGITGTLRFMAPEQFHGQTDVRSDVYSLGLTLYELLTLRPAYDEPDHSSLIHRITHSDPQRPAKINPSIPRDLETIVLKAIARDPDHRYESADAMAADLRRFIEDRPITARQVTSAERLWRWSRRNPVVAVLSATVLLLAVLTAGISAIGYVQTQHALAAEARQRNRAEKNAELAFAALDRIFERFAPTSGHTYWRLALDNGQTIGTQASAPMLSPQIAGLLEELLGFYDELARRGADERAVRWKVAGACQRVGSIQHQLGQYAQAIVSYRRAVGLYGKLTDDKSGGANVPLIVARLQNELGLLYRRQRDDEKSTETHKQALEILEALARSGANTKDIRYEQARTHYFLGSGRPDESVPPHLLESTGPRRDGPPDEGPPRRRPDRREHDGPPDGRRDGPPRRRPGRRGILPQQENRIERDRHLAQAVTILEALEKEDHTNGNYRYLLALCYHERFLRGRRHRAEGYGEWEIVATAIMKRLIEDFPGVPDYRHRLAHIYSVRMGPDSLDLERSEDAIDRYTKALELMEGLVGKHPHIPAYQGSLANVLHKLGAALGRSGRHGEAVDHLRRSVRIQSALVGRFDGALGHKLWLAVYQHRLAEALTRGRKPAEARKVLLETAAILTGLLEKLPTEDADMVKTMLDENRRRTEDLQDDERR